MSISQNEFYLKFLSQITINVLTNNRATTIKPTMVINVTHYNQNDNTFDWIHQKIYDTVI